MLLDRREFETKMTLTRPKASRLGPVLPFDVVDDRRFLPSQEGRNYQAYALAAACRRKGENVFRPVVSQVVQVIRGFIAPAADVYATSGGDQSCFLNVFRTCPTRRSVNVLGVLR